MPASPTPTSPASPRAPASGAPSEAPASQVVERSAAFVEAHRTAAESLGRSLATEVSDADAFLAKLRAGFATLADPHYADEQDRVAPGLGQRIGVRNPLVSATQKAFDRATRRDSADTILWLADRLLRPDVPELEVRVFAFHLLTRILPHDPERAWQLIRRASRAAADWITIDSLAHVLGAGILLEPYRWSEIEQLVFSPSPWERRLVGSTIATLPFVNRRAGREQLVADRSLPIVANLIGDAEPDVQKAISWALRSIALIDPAAVAEFCEREARRAAETDDGHRAWVIRDTLPKLEQSASVDSARLTETRRLLNGIRRRPSAPSTSDAGAVAARFADLPTADELSEAPL